MNRWLFFTACSALAPFAQAVTPAFDRPGIAVTTTTVPAGGIAWEQGLPDFVRDSRDGTSLRAYAANTNLRFGLSDTFELRLFGSPWNYQRLVTPQGRSSNKGYGDTGIGFKWAGPSTSKAFSWALLATASFATGEDDFSSGSTAYDVAASLGWAFDDSVSATLYADAGHQDGSNSYTISPSLGFALSERWAAFVEAGYTHAKGSPDNAVAGGGFTWMASERVQLDLSADFGVNAATPDVQGGFGVSIYFD
ncbi:outer membrane putative beta-barrel porin/alpha-amylase [Tahibacter aquaticus]|uniref:Outer membrane putative beta-barrel porin/alpha-amylase n=1 Tax=Tahibacter aquaticus TaxID=520092 RepID=A0A4R6Z109_9GAMM|nr:transporter [Tahibacter aquaticus]TDR45069.1 outer membrane putative beta-barrel porin/alpha-amylase [Tahibacter aquaticus]